MIEKLTAFNVQLPIENQVRIGNNVHNGLFVLTKILSLPGMCCFDVIVCLLNKTQHGNLVKNIHSSKLNIKKQILKSWVIFMKLRQQSKRDLKHEFASLENG